MSKIIKLDKQLANQIAAWEVVERPVSVVKELVEDSIDSWAKNIKIEIENGWCDRIIITDDGEWIEKDDLPLVIEKYSTSKIKNLEDLYNVMTFGFRWEALASISSISHIEIVSKYKDMEFWYGFKAAGSEVWKINKYPSETGTKITVENLFYNTPARLNYLKKPRTEYSHILTFLQQISLSYPNIWFEFISDHKQIFKYQKKENLRNRIYSIYWEKFSENLLEINFSLNWIEISGYISDPKISFANRNRQSLFVNKRVIKSPLIFKAINDAYNRFIPHNQFPWYVLNIQVDPTQVDVNVHPRKMEVRFASEQNIFRTIHHTIEEKLDKVSLIGLNPNDNSSQNTKWAQNFTSTDNIKEPEPKYYSGSWTKFKSYSPYSNQIPNPSQSKIWESMQFSKEILQNSSSLQEQELSTDLHNTPIWKIIWQSHNSYIVVETWEWIKILDQHALAERVIYEKLISNQYEAKTQWLLIWQSLQLTPKEISILEENESIFKEMGFDFEIISWNSLILNGIPDFIKKENLKMIFLWVLEDIWEQNFPKSKTLEEVKNKIFAYTSCRSAIKFWHKLNLFEINKLLHDASLDYSTTCPHGRPVMFEISLDEMKGKYER
jgi:DNA mismatch repair protein MutL